MFRLVTALIIVLATAACASGSTVITGTKRPSIAATAVQLYTKPPSNYESIGIVKASSEMGMTEQGSTDYAIEELKKQAASIGANGVIVTAVGGRSNTSSVTGEAIYVRGK